MWNVADGNCCGAERRKGKSAVRDEMILCNGDGAKVHKLCKFAPSLMQENGKIKENLTVINTLRIEKKQ